MATEERPGEEERETSEEASSGGGGSWGRRGAGWLPPPRGRTRGEERGEVQHRIITEVSLPPPPCSVQATGCKYLHLNNVSLISRVQHMF